MIYHESTNFVGNTIELLTQRLLEEKWLAE